MDNSKERKNGLVILIVGLIIVGVSLLAIKDDGILCIPFVGWGVLMVFGGLVQTLSNLGSESSVDHHDNLPRDQR